MDVGKRIDYFRKQKNWSVNYLANRAGISQSYNPGRKKSDHRNDRIDLQSNGNGGAWNMKQFTVDLYKNIQRPVVFLKDWHQFDAMIDTGALFPVWVEEEKALVKLGAECIKKNVRSISYLRMCNRNTN